MGDHGLDVLDLLVWGKIAELRVLSNNGLDVDRGADLSGWNPGPLYHHALLLRSHHAHHGLLFLLLGHEGLLLWIMAHDNRLWLARVVLDDLLLDVGIL